MESCGFVRQMSMKSAYARKSYGDIDFPPLRTLPLST